MLSHLDVSTLESTSQMKLGLSQPSPSPSQILPTLHQLSAFVSALLPFNSKDVAFLYHTPRPPRSISSQAATLTLPPNSNFDRILPVSEAPIRRMILSITPTPGVYDLLQSPTTNPNSTLLFLHRPFNLDRRRMPYGTTALASHTAFDETLTVGFNTILASRLGMITASSVCLKGYKGDPERRIGILGTLSSGSESLAILLENIKREFGSWDAVYGVDLSPLATAAERLITEQPQHLDPGSNPDDIRVLAIMNAFHPEEVARVLHEAHSNNWIPSLADGSNILYLTGQAREPGLQAAREKGIKVVCVGHRVCEEWGIRFLAQQVRNKHPSVEVIEVMEQEEEIARTPPVKKRRKQEGKTKRSTVALE